MTFSEGERIAPVTYLFGAGTPGTASAGAATELPPRSETVPGPVLVEEPHPDLPRGSFLPINNVSMRALARRGMSAREMRDYLIGREFDETEVEFECERLVGVGLLDDALLAETLVRTLRERKGFGRGAIVSELRRRHLDPLAIEAALEEETGGDAEIDRAVAIAEKRARQLTSLDPETAKRRLGAFLQRKGYSGSIVSTAVARALTPSGPVFR